ncbi:MAG: Na+/H+ antiporter subunit E [Ilumatobacter sp.]|uniref:Na+/H+ antiporter subunit E n=1 Tax=Ilumatobacter sp. TaxID=1967498 RepID=UPI002604B62D|nr:Na+/H+ antiporter subunit E [Ilumatobacter sp.]MDJ0769785.1 Na+/H+ antiporter subunit E [Ilumatobacter sp.]
MPERRHGWRSQIILGLLLLGLWLLFSGHYDVFHISAGVLSVAFVLTLNRSLFKVRLYPGDVHRPLRLLALAGYLPWLMKEILIAALQVARIVLTRRMPVDPSLVEFHAELPNAAAQTVLANSITLTPGTVTIDVAHGVFLVHAITDPSSENLVEGVMPARVVRLFEGDESGAVTDVSIHRWVEE